MGTGVEGVELDMLGAWWKIMRWRWQVYWALPSGCRMRCWRCPGCVGAPLVGLDVGDVPVGVGWWETWWMGSCWSVGCITGNKTAMVGNCLAGGPVKNRPLNVFQLSKHWCLSFPHCLCGGRLELALCCLGSSPEQPLLAFCCVLVSCSPLRFKSCEKALEAFF